MQEKAKKLTTNENLALVLYFCYVLGNCAFKRGFGFDAIFCRLSFILLIAYELVFNVIVVQKGKLILTYVLKRYMIFILFYFVAIIWGNVSDGLYYINSFTQIIGTALVLTQHVHSKKDINKYLKAIVLALGITSIILIMRTPISYWGTERLGEDMGLNANSLGIRYAFCGVVSLYFANDDKKFYSIFAISILITLFSGSRTAFVILLIGMTIYWSFKCEGLKTFFNLIIIIAAVAFLIYIVMNNQILYRVLGRRFTIWWNATHGIGNAMMAMSTNERAFYRQYAFKMFLDSPLFGHGANSFVTQMRNMGYTHVAYSHNTYTELLATLGIIGFCMYFIPQFRSFKIRIKKLYLDRNPYNAMLLAMVVMLLLSQWYTISYISSMWQSYIILILISCDPALKKDKQI